VVLIVVKKYNDNYVLELVGEDLCNFHGDFDMSGANSEMYAIGGLFLG